MTGAEVIAAWHKVRPGMFTPANHGHILALAAELGIEVTGPGVNAFGYLDDGPSA